MENNNIKNNAFISEEEKTLNWEDIQVLLKNIWRSLQQLVTKNHLDKRI